MQQIDVMIPAGEGEKLSHYSPLLDQARVNNKALIKITGKPMISYVLKALDEASSVRSITIVGLKKEHLDVEVSKPLQFIPGGDTTFDTVINGVKYFLAKEEPPEFIMSVSCDIPLITGEMIDRYMNTIDWSTGKGYYFPLVWKDNLLKHYPRVTKKAFKVKGGDFFGGDVHIFRPELVLENEEGLQQFLGNRKKFFKLVRIISLRNIFRYKFGWLTLNIIEDIFKKQYGLNGAYAIFAFPEVCADLDYVEDLSLFDELCSKSPRKLTENDIVTIKSQYW